MANKTTTTAVTKKPTARVVEIDSVKLLSALNEKTLMLTGAVIGATFNMEQMAERNIAVGRLFMVEEIKALVAELVEDATNNVLEDDDL